MRSGTRCAPGAWRNAHRPPIAAAHAYEPTYTEYLMLSDDEALNVMQGVLQ